MLEAGGAGRGVDAELCGWSCAARRPAGCRGTTRSAPRPQSTRPIDPDAPTIVGFTSGTTSGAKGAVVSTRGMLDGPDAPRARAVPYTFRDRGYMPAPVSHITGLLMAVTLPLVSGCSVLLAERWDAAKAVDDIVRHRVTYSGGAAVFIQELVDAVDAAGLPALPLACGLQLRWERDPVRAGAAVRGTGHEAASRLRDDRVPDRLRQHGRRRPRDPPPHRRSDPARRRRARRRRRRVRRGGRRGGGVPRPRPPARPWVPGPAGHPRRLRRRRLVPQRRPRVRRRRAAASR